MGIKTPSYLKKTGIAREDKGGRGSGKVLEGGRHKKATSSLTVGG